MKKTLRFPILLPVEKICESDFNEVLLELSNTLIIEKVEAAIRHVK